MKDNPAGPVAARRDPIDPQREKRNSLAGAAAWTPALSKGLLALYGEALACALHEFEIRAARQLGRLVGFDGAIWGMGTTGGAHAPITIAHAAVVDRPLQLLPDYDRIAALDPVTTRFLQAPSEPIAAEVRAVYRTRPLSPIRDYLLEYNIGQLLLLGARNPSGTSLAWITAYRETADRPFTANEVQRFRALLPHWLQARELCAQLNLARHARGCGADAGVALCDRRGLLHATDPRFSVLTGRAIGDCLQPDAVECLLAGADHAAGDARIVATESGPWLILSAREATVHPRLPPRLADVAQRYASGARYKQIARDTGRSPATIRTQLQAIFSRLGVHTRTELINTLRQH